ncbi:unnamed protein product [Dibothriocephalus latus]|uniref:Uncharacterized protein n=1 Tax=Dibothriocephalus latus TaxID=60516 RepID=A0A3P7LTL5_DIBLA|nr:unnamed protein product [Dibothriocephalus latus]
MSAKLRQVALATILLRAGLSFDPAVVRVSGAGGVTQMAIIPCLTEAFSTTVICKNLLGWSWAWAAMLGICVRTVREVIRIICTILPACCLLKTTTTSVPSLPEACGSAGKNTP